MQTLEITPTAANLPAYVSEVKSESLSRKLQELAGGLLDAEQDPETALAHAQDIIGTLSREQGAEFPGTQRRPGWPVAQSGRTGRRSGPVHCIRHPGVRQTAGRRIYPRGLHIIGARPAVGKSALALQITLNAARKGIKVLYVSLEMDSEDCAARLVGNICGASAARLMFGDTCQKTNTGSMHRGQRPFLRCRLFSTGAPA